MSKKIKIPLYALLLAAACTFGSLAFRNYKTLMDHVADAPESTAAEVPVAQTRGEALATRGYANVMMFGVAFLVSVLPLGFLLAHDVSHYLGDRALQGMYNDEGEGMSNPDYEQAEQVWADGDHLEAIRLMRDYLNRNPREQHVAIRIAEIYEKDLQNNLAAALEYEEVLKHKLPAQRWGWCAIHLCNLYFRLNQPDKAVALLRRIDAEYGETAAAEKARKRLALIDGKTEEEIAEGPAPARENPAS